MAVTGIQAVGGAGAASTGRGEAVTAPSSFADALASQQQLDAARAVLSALPAPIVYSLRDKTGSPADSVDRLFGVLKEGSFQPPAGALGRPDSIIGATAHAATLFDSPSQLWDAMRAAIADPASAAAALRGGAGPARTSTATGPAAGAPTPEVHTLEEAERLLTDIRARGAGSLNSASAGVSAGAREAEWWEAALRFLLGARFPA